YKYRNVRSTYTSLNRYIDFIFTYEKYSELNIEKTIDHLEGLFRKLEWKLNNYKGLTKSITRCL
ncbi:transposase, partial [Glaesserella parasuis]|nr:transposase [Glaesserella parasuis]